MDSGKAGSLPPQDQDIGGEGQEEKAEHEEAAGDEDGGQGYRLLALLQGNYPVVAELRTLATLSKATVPRP